jgi:hypothetical protein
MVERSLIIELQHGADAVAMTAAPPALAGVTIDASFGAVEMPRLVPRDPGAVSGLALASSDVPTFDGATTLVRGHLGAGADADAVHRQLLQQPGVVGVFADLAIEPCTVCPGSAPVGSDADVERLLGVPALARCRMDGSGVTVAIVDTGVNIEYLRARGKTPRFDRDRSWGPRAGMPLGAMPVHHGTMVAYDVCIAAPRCTLIDVPLLGSTAAGGSRMEGLLSDAVRAYRHLLTLMQGPRRPGENASLVVNNSWGMFQPSWDYPVGHPGNYSDNPAHPFNRIVATLAAAGADILFAAGNCGAECPDGRCGGITARAIYGANGHPDVLCVAGVDVLKQRVGYSSAGPGRLAPQKPDVSGYTHFRGSGVWAADGGTSAATPVVAGVIAAVRCARPYVAAVSSTHPAAIRALVTGTAEDRGEGGFDYQYGWGIVSGDALRARVCRQKLAFCERFPRLCRRIAEGQWPVEGPDALDPDAPAELAEAFWAGAQLAATRAGGAPAGPPSQPAVAAAGCGCGGIPSWARRAAPGAPLDGGRGDDVDPAAGAR